MHAPPTMGQSQKKFIAPVGWMVRPSARAFAPYLAPPWPPIHPQVVPNGHGADNGPWYTWRRFRRKHIHLGRIPGVS